MRERRRKFSPEFKDEAVKMVIESSRAIAEVAREIQVNEGTLGNWVNKYRVEHADEEYVLGNPVPLTSAVARGRGLRHAGVWCVIFGY